MPFSVSWSTLLEECDELPSDATLVTPNAHKEFRLTDVQEQRIIIEFPDGESRPLQRDQFETLYQRIYEANGEYDLGKLPVGAEPYAAVLSLHPRYEVNEDRGAIIESETATTTQLVDEGAEDEETERKEPDLDVYADALLLVDALERHEVESLTELETGTLVNLYTLLSDVQRNSNNLRQDVADVLLDRVHHDQPVHSQYGSVQRTSRRNRSLKDEETVLEVLEDAGVDRERVMSVDRSKVDEVLDVITVPESAVYDVEEREYVRKAEVNEDTKETRLQGLKDSLATSDEPEAEELREEIEELESRINELTEFRTGQTFS